MQKGGGLRRKALWMYKIGDIVVYGTEGLCEICDITEKTFGKENIEYYVLRPKNKIEETVYVPKNNEKILTRMRHILTRDEANALLEATMEDSQEWVVCDRDRMKLYKDILLYGSSKDILQMTRTLYLHQLEQLEVGKKLHAADERFLRDAEKMLFEELAYVFNISIEEVLPMIIEKKEATA